MILEYLAYLTLEILTKLKFSTCHESLSCHHNYLYNFISFFIYNFISLIGDDSIRKISLCSPDPKLIAFYSNWYMYIWKT